MACLATSSLSSLSSPRRFLSALGMRSRMLSSSFCKRLDLVLDVLAHGLGQRIEHLGLDHLALVHGRHGEAGRRAQDGDVLGLRLACSAPPALPRGRTGTARRWRAGAPGSPRFRTAPAGRFCNSSSAADHALCEDLRPAMRELQRLRPVGVVEIVDVDPVGGRGRLGGLGPEVRLHCRGLARGRRAQHEHIEVVALDVGAELDGLQRPILADQPGDGLQLVRGLEAERSPGSTTRRSSEASSGCGRAATVVTCPWRRLRGSVMLLRRLKKCHKPPGC